MQSIDLHGYREEEIMGPVLSAIYSLREGEEIEIITGNGQVLRDVVLEIIQEEQVAYKYEGNNYGAIIIYK